MKRTKQVLAIALTLALALGIVPFTPMTAQAAGTAPDVALGQTYLNQASVFDQSNGDGYTPYDLK